MRMHGLIQHTSEKLCLIEGTNTANIEHHTILIFAYLLQERRNLIIVYIV